MIEADACKLYIAILYFDTCIFQEEEGNATFKIDKEGLAQRIRYAVNKNKDKLLDTIEFDNGLKKKNALNNISNFNKYYKEKYGFCII